MFQKRIVLDSTETMIHSNDAFAIVAYLRIKEAHLEIKSDQNKSSLTHELLEMECVERLLQAGNRCFRWMSKQAFKMVCVFLFNFYHYLINIIRKAVFAAS